MDEAFLAHLSVGRNADAAQSAGRWRLQFLKTKKASAVHLVTVTIQNIVNDYMESGSTIECEAIKAIPPWKRSRSIYRKMKQAI